MIKYSKIKLLLDNLKIPYQLIEHPPVFTAEQADKYVSGIDCKKTKSLFLTNRKQTEFYLVFMSDNKRLNMKKFAQIVNEKHVSFAPDEVLLQKLGVKTGTVSVFNLLNNIDKDVQVFFEQDLLGNIPLTFHPNDNTKTILIKPQDVFKFLTMQDYDYELIKVKK
ncbi:prolyl-tRNA synthetase associated domain-containing protein [Companilactobacillus sp. HBUAS59544]|uniref:prolyl-tRNA synthetase associated domain-containing protein n=1 Tax=Companilactobacillus sp. HBUAS59544 TaxID=3109363 RepID=UPI002FF314D4